MTQIVKFPDAAWGRLASLAETREVSIADLIVETAEHLLPGPKRRWSRYTPEAGARIAEGRRLHRSWVQIAAAEGLAIETAKRWHTRHLNEHANTHQGGKDSSA